MAKVSPFRGVRPAAEYADKMISLPYDVMNRKEAAEMAKGNPYSFLHICRSEIDLPEIEDPYCDAVYLKAKENIETYIKDGVLIQEDAPVFYIYKQVMDGRTQVGIVACASIDDYQEGIIKRHEFTRHEKEIDRINHFDTCNANTEPVFLTYRKNSQINEIVQEWMNQYDPVYDLVASDQIAHTLWVIDDAAINEKISSLFESVNYLYIADGHHRTASAAAVGAKRREANPNYTGDEEFNRFMAVIFPDEQLHVMDYNRVVQDLNDLSEAEFFEAVDETFEIEKIGAEEYKPQKKHEFSMYLNGIWYKMTAKEGTYNPVDPVESLDASILQYNLLDPVLGIKDPRKDKRIDFVGGIRGLGELKRRVEEGMKVAFALYPVTIQDLMDVSDAGLIMPPKSTWFEPKLGSGLFMHLL